jgi:hypothetical protein
MRRIAVVVLSAVAVGCSEGPAAPGDQGAQFARLDGAEQGGMLFTTSLSGAEEAPGPGDPDGSGWFAMTINPGQGLLCYELSVEDVDGTISGAHIHRAPAGSPGGVVVPLTAPVSGASSGCVPVAAELLREIRKDPAAFYVNVHSLPSYGPGAVRGQLGD